MDVSCPNCNSEYELEEARLRPGGVTVKCANCEHVFRVRKRGDSALSKVKKPGRTRPATGRDEEQTWLVRLADGEIKVCRELATLQRWIVSGVVSSDCEISRTGKKWKPLHQLKELRSFFSIAQEAQDVASGRISAPGAAPIAAEGTQVAGKAAPKRRPNTLPRSASSPAPAESSYNDEMTLSLTEQPFLENEQDTVEMSLEEASTARAASRAPSDPGDTIPTIEANLVRAEIAKNKSLQKDKAHVSTMLGTAVPAISAKPKPKPARVPSIPPPAPKAKAPPPMPREALDKERDSSQAMSPKRPKAPSFSPAAALSGPGPIPASAPSGPTGGLGKHVPISDVAFGASDIGGEDSSSEFQNGQFLATDSFPDPVRQSSGAGKWIVLVSLLLLGAAGAVLYFVLFKDKPNSDSKTVAQEQILDAGQAEGKSADAAAIIPKDKASTTNEIVSEAIARHDRQEIEGLLNSLEKSPESSERSVGQSRLYNAMAQHELDEGLLNPKSARKRKKSSRSWASKASKLAESVLKKDSEDIAALLAKADAQRLSGSTSRSVERNLKRAATISKNDPEERYVSAMLRLRDRRVRDAQTILEKLKATDATTRVKYRLAMIEVGEKDFDRAQELVSDISGVDGENKTAGQLRAFLESKVTVEAPAGDDDDDDDTRDPIATADPTNPDTEPSSNEPSSNEPSSNEPSSSGGGGYDQLLERADKAAETGSCKQAVKIYEKALDKNPSGVAALTGLGYCHLDFKNYASAQARFRAALGISSRYQDALWGVAEAYQQQGLKPKAIEAYRKFIDKHPSSRRAGMAKRQIERLGGNPEQKEPEASDPTTPPADPPTDPAPENDSKPPEELVPEATSGSDETDSDSEPG